MKKTLIMLIGLMLVMSVSSFASQTRTMVMGDNHMIMVDDYNMFMFPGRVNNYPNLAMGEFDYGDEMYQFGITWQFNDDNPWVLGTFVSYEPEFGPENFWGSNMSDFDDASYDDERRFQIIYGRQLGGNNFGFSLEAVRYSEEYEWLPDQHQKECFGQYTFMVGLTEATSGKWDVSVGFMTGSWTTEDGDGNAVTEPDGFMDFGFAGRYFMVRSPKVTLVPHVAVMMGKRGFKHYDYTYGAGNDADDYGMKWSRTAFELGLGMNYTPAPNVLAVFDIGFEYDKIKTEGGLLSDTEDLGNDTWTAFPYLRVGFEGEVFSWMDIRGGATASLWTSKYTEESVQTGNEWKDTYDYSSNDTYFGFGFHWGSLYLDTYTDPELLLRGPNFISGDYDGDDMNWEVSLTYEMF